MTNQSSWKSDKARYEAAWQKYEQVADRIYAAYEEVDSGAQDQTPANEDMAELQQAWQELEEARDRLGERMNEVHERHMNHGKTAST